MNEEEFKALVGETAFNAMSAEQRTAALAKFTPPAPPKKTKADDQDDDEEDDESDDLVGKARKQRDADDKDQERVKRLESSIAFNMKSEEFLKQNESLLPSDVHDIFKAAQKENYADQTEKADALKAGVIQSFFAVQANVDLLTSGQKRTLDDYLKLTKTGKQDKAQAVYEMIFEPAFELLKREKKAEALRKGHGTGSDDAYKARLMKGSRQHYLGEKNQ